MVESVETSFEVCAQGSGFRLQRMGHRQDLAASYLQRTPESKLSVNPIRMILGFRVEALGLSCLIRAQDLNLGSCPSPNPDCWLFRA